MCCATPLNPKRRAYVERCLTLGRGFGETNVRLTGAGLRAMGLTCVLCGRAHLPSEPCGRDTEGGLGRRGRAREVGALTTVDEPLTRAPDAGARRPGRRAGGFDRAAYQREYMRVWRARRKAT